MTANLQNPIFIDETKAREWLKAIDAKCGAQLNFFLDRA